MLNNPVHDYESTATSSYWYARVTVTKGGAAGKGPEPPEPPVMSTDGSAQYPNMMEELDGGESEGKTKMAFAKMQIPSNLRDAYMLTDNDFLFNLEKEDVSAVENSQLVEEGGEQQFNDSALISEHPQLQLEDPNSSDKPGKLEATGSISSVRSSRSPSMRSLSRGSISYADDANDSPSDERKSSKADRNKKNDHNNSTNSPDAVRKDKKKKQQKESNANEQAAKLGLYA